MLFMLFFHWKIVWIICTLFINLPYPRSKLLLFESVISLDPIYNSLFTGICSFFVMYNCKCQQHAEVYFPDESNRKKPQQPSHPYLSYLKHLTVQSTVCLCNTVLRFPVYTEFSSMLWAMLEGRSLWGSWSSSLVASGRRQLGCKQPESFTGKLVAAGRVSVVAAGGRRHNKTAYPAGRRLVSNGLNKAHPMRS